MPMLQMRLQKIIIDSAVVILSKDFAKETVMQLVAVTGAIDIVGK